MIPVAFYAPLKSPDHAVPSGDRTMGRLLLAALRRAGFEPTIASELRSLDLVGDRRVQEDIRAQALSEAADIAATFRARPADQRPRLWFTYHCYYKAPDWIGPAVSDALGIPYVVAEGSRSARRAEGPWALGHAGAEAALDRANCLLVMTPADAEDLTPALRPSQHLVELPPFLDTDAWRAPAEPCSRPAAGPLRLLTVAMMREGDKLASYRLLAEALSLVPAGWTLDIAGDGSASSDVQRLFAGLGDRVRFCGALHGQALAAAYGEADLLFWPAVGEAYGMTLLEAQACGCPILAGREGGVPSVLREGETGLLVERRNARAFAAALLRIIEQPTLLQPMRAAAIGFVHGERGLAQAAAILGSALGPLVPPSAAVDPATAAP